MRRARDSARPPAGRSGAVPRPNASIPAAVGIVQVSLDMDMSARWVRNLVILVYLVIGGFIAWDHGYLGLSWLRALASAVLAIFLWWLVLLGVNLHIHG